LRSPGNHINRGSSLIILVVMELWKTFLCLKNIIAMTKNQINSIAYGIVGCAIEVHRQFGPGLLESVYQECLKAELLKKGFDLKVEHHVPLFYKGEKLASKLKLDLLVNDQVIVELKSVDTLAPVFTAQLLTYMKLAEKPKGLLINFNSENIVSGSVALVNDFFASLPD